MGMSQAVVGLSSGCARTMDREVTAFYYENFIRFKVKSFVIEPVFSYTTSANAKPGDEMKWHNVTYIASDLNFLFTPFQKGRFLYLFGLGLSVQKRNETNPYFWRTYVAEEDQYKNIILYKNKSDMNLGSTIKMIFQYQLSKTITSGMSINLKTYQNGGSSINTAINLGYNF